MRAVAACLKQALQGRGFFLGDSPKFCVNLLGGVE